MLKGASPLKFNTVNTACLQKKLLKIQFKQLSTNNKILHLYTFLNLLTLQNGTCI
jgi:hypothetical protein